MSYLSYEIRMLINNYLSHGTRGNGPDGAQVHIDFAAIVEELRQCGEKAKLWIERKRAGDAIQAAEDARRHSLRSHGTPNDDVNVKDEAEPEGVDEKLL